jgi:hypothetical protein
MEVKIELRYIQPPVQLLNGFVEFSQEISRKCAERGVKFSEEEITDLFNNSFPGRIRAEFFLWIGELNKIIEGMNILLIDLSDLRKDKNSLKGNSVIRSELLLQTFFGEFFRMREISKIFMKSLTHEKVLSKKSKEYIMEWYFEVFEKTYEIRNKFIHQGLSFKDDDVNVDASFLEKLSVNEREKFIAILQASNTRENTVEIQCALYMNFIKSHMNSFIEFQELLNSILADLIIQFEKEALSISISDNK